ncbi:MAG: hypothetical protein K2X55_02370 [Burkholderiaceae bacterium]|nr:hypothetical protein [Burkholderiaceae bacterium]
MTDYTKKAQKIASDFAKKGQASVLRRIKYGDYDTDTGKPVVLSDTSYPCYVMSFDYDSQSSGASTEPGSLIQVGDKQILLPAYGLGTVPEMGDLLIVGAKIVAGAPVGGITWTVKNIKETNPVGIPLLYELNGRK